MNLGEAYYDHFERYLGAPAAGYRFRRAGEPMIQVLEYRNVFEGCAVFCTLGLSHYQDRLGGLCEVCAPVDSAWDRVPRILAAMLDYMIERPVRVRRGSAVSGVENIDQDFAREYGKRAIYFTSPYALPAGFARVPFGEAEGDVLLALFIAQAEYDFLAASDPEAFEDLLERTGADPLALRRPPCVGAQ